jgi:S1-C subfamily serine protease
MEEGYLIAATADGRLLPVTEILAASQRTDTCIVRVEADERFEPLPLNPRVSPGDEAWCFSDPAGKEGYFTQGIVNRFFRHQGPDEDAPIRMNVSTDWAPGSSGAAVIDACGNAIGHVSRISARGSNNIHDADEADEPTETLIVFHSAVRAADVLALVKPH